MITVGVKVKGQTSLKPIPGIELKFCPTYKALEKYEVKLLENVKKDDIDKVKALKGQVYSIGAVDADIKLLTLPIVSLEEILGEKYAIQQEKQRSIEAIRQTTEEKNELEKKVESQTSNLKELREKTAELRQKVEQREKQIDDLKTQVQTISGKLAAESKLRQEAERELKAAQDELYNSINEGAANLEEQKKHSDSIFSQQIEKFNEKLRAKDDIIAEKDNTIKDLQVLNEELSKSGSIPDIPYKYEGPSKIVGFCSHGSYGVTNIVYTVQDILSQSYNVLIVDFDLRGGNLNRLCNSENVTIENVLKGGSILREHLLSDSNRTVDLCGGVTQIWNVYDIINLPFDEIFKGDYSYILIDLGIYGGYNIQTKLTDMIQKNGTLFNIYAQENRKLENAINIKNFCRKGDRTGIPFVSNILANNLTLNDDNLTKEYIHELIVNPILEIN